MLENYKMHVKDFPGASIKCMQDYVKLSHRENSDVLIIHVGTNNMSINKQLKQIAVSLKSYSFDVTLHNRNDGYQRNVTAKSR